MKRLAALAIAATALLALPAAAQDRTPVLVVVTSDNAQTQLMSMILTMQAAQKGAAPHILLCGAAGDIALRDAPESATTTQPPRDLSPQGLMQTIMQQTGTEVQVCAIYLPAQDLDASALIDGVTVADPAEMGAMIADPAVKVLGF